MSLEAELAGLVAAIGQDIHALNTGKQNTLVPGANITIDPVTNVITSTGGGGGGGQSVTLSGPTSAYITTTETYTITNFDSFSAYTASISDGSASISGDTVTVTAPSSAQTATLTITRDGQPQAFEIEILPASVATPTITNPTPGQTGVLDTPTVTTSAFSTICLPDTHLNSDWELWSGPGRTGTLVASLYASTTNKTSWTTPALTVSTTYYLSVRHRGATLGASEWAEAQFTTAATFSSYIPTPTATPANFGDPLEGGFYAGMIWNQIAQSASSKALATGTQTFTVPDMTGAPIVYGGQTIEVRSRANPVNKFIGTVVGAVGTTLTLSVTSIGGSGTFADWSVMARHRVIVAPKSSGENASVALKNAATALPAACQTLTEGWAATEAMRLADTSTVYPAAHWARGLTIGGRADWYIPARDELELCWRNLKPVTAGNYTAADRPSAGISYANNGSVGDTAPTHGTNNNSSPTGATYTSGSPAQTAATEFRAGGAEAFATLGSNYYMSCSEAGPSSADAWYASYDSSPGRQIYAGGKNSPLRLRAVRRSAI